jgi:hypothetical protein
MSTGSGGDTAGSYHFLAWARRGLAGVLANPDYGGSLPARGQVSVGLTVTAGDPGPAQHPITPVSVQTYGPGDILGFDPWHVVRTEPPPYTPNFEPNYLAAIEFDEPDFPWLFTPAAVAGDRIRPWLVLIVLAAAEYADVPGAAVPLPAIDVATLGALQPLADSWNWAHAQVSGDGGLAATLAAAPGSVNSRLICPRRLSPETSYTAFVVPAFEIGRLAGLGLDTAGVTTSDPAWTTGTAGPLRLPVYYRFQFGTSDQGDFESLVRRLTPTVLGGDIGQRPMAVDDPEPGFASAGVPLELPGALASLATSPTLWGDPGKTAFQAALQALVNRNQPVTDDSAGPDPQLVPPIYGCWPAGVFSVSPAGTGWLDELNLDPRNRTAAGLGAQVVQGGLTALLASAWQQVAGVQQANALLRRAQLARAVLTTLHGQRLSAATSHVLLALTAPLHPRLLASPQTVHAAIAASRVPQRLFSPALRRIASPAGPIRRRQVRLGQTPGALAARVNAGTLTIVPPPAEPGGLISLEDIADGKRPGWLDLFPIVITADSPEGTIRAVVQAKPAGGPLTIAALTPAAITDVPARPDFAVTTPGSPLPAPGAAGANAVADSAEARLFRAALVPLAEALQAAAPDPQPAPALDLQALRDTVVQRLDPAITVPARLGSIITLGPGLTWNPPDPIRPIMAAPSFPQPMYAPLRDLSPQYILPGADQVPDESVSLLVTNHAFIEAYLTGLNHEMARQLLWADYPTDCMGSYFRQFWDVSGYVRQPGDPADPAALAEALRDIPPINTWPLAGPLGTHENRAAIPADNVSLLIRGELLRRYPDTIIYAAKATLAGNTRVIDTSDERYPIFSGTLPTDITFLGFNLSAVDAKGGTAAAPEGFFFVFEQHPTGPRFGLEPSAAGPVTQWADLAWTSFGGQPGQQAQAFSPSATGAASAFPPDITGPFSPWQRPSTIMRTVLAQGEVPDFLSAGLPPAGVAVTGPDAANQWGIDAAQTAYITLRLPFRVAIHADLLVPS